MKETKCALNLTNTDRATEFVFIRLSENNR